MRSITLLAVLYLCVSTQVLMSQQIETDYLNALSLARSQQKGLIYVFVDKELETKETQGFKTNFLESNAFRSLSMEYIVLEVNCSPNTDSESDDALYCKRLTSVYNKYNKFPAVLATNNKLQPKGALQTDFSKEAVSTYLESLK